MKARLNNVCLNKGSLKYSSFTTVCLRLHCVFGTKMGWVFNLSPAHTFKAFYLGYAFFWLSFGKV